MKKDNTIICEIRNKAEREICNVYPPQKLHTVRPRNFILVKDWQPVVPVGAPPIRNGDILFFDHVDGIYSYCKTIDKQIVLLSVFAEVIVIPAEEIIDKGWECDFCHQRYPDHKMGCETKAMV
jgi:hypothetical protein